MSSYRRYYLPSISWSDVKGGVWRIQPYSVTDYFFIFRVQNLLTSAPWLNRLLVGGLLYYLIFHPICHGLIAYLLGDFSYNMNFSPPTYAIADISRLGNIYNYQMIFSKGLQNMMTQTRIAVTNRTICYELYKQAGLASAEDTPLTCLSRQIRVLLNNNSYDKILVREKDLSVEEYHEFIADIFSAQHSYRSATNLTSNNCTSPKNPLTINSRSDNSTLTKSICSDGFNIMSSRIIVHNFPAVAEEFGTDLHLPFFMFTNLLCQSGNSGQNNFQNSLSNSSVLASDASGTSVITSNNDLTHGTSVITSDNGLSHENTTSATTSSDGFRRKYPHIKRIGTSIHSVEDAVFAESHGADYITAGHIFTTDCKKGLPGRGIDWLKSICNAVSIPVYAIGGISDANVSMLYDCNISGYCMMSASMKPILSE